MDGVMPISVAIGTETVFKVQTGTSDGTPLVDFCLAAVGDRKVHIPEYTATNCRAYISREPLTFCGGIWKCVVCANGNTGLLVACHILPFQLSAENPPLQDLAQ